MTQHEEFARVANQQRIDPTQTMDAPCQNDSESGVRKSMAAKAADRTGMKYEAYLFPYKP